MIFIRIAAALVLAYCIILALLWLFQSRLIHLPDLQGRELTATPADIGLDFEEITIDTSDGERLHGWFVPAKRARAVMLFFHGNAGNISHRLDSLALFHELDLSVLIIDYRGYGRSTGKPGEQGLYRDAEAAFGYLRDQRKIPDRNIVVFGRSLGAAVAARLAASHRVAAVILESAFKSTPAMAAEHYRFVPAGMLLRHRYDTLSAIGEVKDPVLVIHSREDEIIPFRHGREIHQAASDPKAFLELRGGHNSGFITSRQRYMAGLRKFLDDNL